MLNVSRIKKNNKRTNLTQPCSSLLLNLQGKKETLVCFLYSKKQQEAAGRYEIKGLGIFLPKLLYSKLMKRFFLSIASRAIDSVSRFFASDDSSR